MFISELLRKITKRWCKLLRTTTRSVQTARDVVISGIVIVASIILIIWLSIFLYTAFYYAYMPSMSYVRPVNLQFKSCQQEKGICSFPYAHVQLTKKQQLLMIGQPYKVNLHLEMPESPANKELGMFMVCAQMRGRDGFLIDHTCRTTMLHYRSTLLHTLKTLTFLPMMIFGSIEEKQDIVLELFSNFEEDQNHPVTIIFIEIQSRHIEFYSANLMINAHLSGLRYMMFYWPTLSASIGIGTNLFFITLICALSYLHFGIEEESMNEKFSYEKGAITDEVLASMTRAILHEDIIQKAILDDSSPEDTSGSSRDEKKDLETEKFVKGVPSYIDEISTVLAESSRSSHSDS